MTVFRLIAVIALTAFLQALYYVKCGFRRVSYTRRFDRESCFAGEKAELTEVLENNKLIPLPWVRVESRISPYLRFRDQMDLDISMEQFHKSVFFLGGFSRITRRHEVTCLRRGLYDCGSVTVTIGDLLGLSGTAHPVETGARLLVYPALMDPYRLPEEVLSWQGDLTVQRWINPDPLLISGITDYRSGDSLRDIHWGATARTGGLKVKVRDYTASPRVLLVFNSQSSETLWNRMEPQQAEFLENGISLCASLAAWCVERGLEVGYTTNGGCVVPTDGQVYIPPSCSAEQLRKLLEALALTKIERGQQFEALLDDLTARGITETDILLISAYDSDNISERAAVLRELGNSVTLIPIEGVYIK